MGRITKIDKILDELEDKGSKHRLHSRLTRRDISRVEGGLPGFAEVFSFGFGENADPEGVRIDRDEILYATEENELMANVMGSAIIDSYCDNPDRLRAIQFTRQAELCFEDRIKQKKRSHRRSERRVL